MKKKCPLMSIALSALLALTLFSACEARTRSDVPSSASSSESESVEQSGVSGAESEADFSGADEQNPEDDSSGPEKASPTPVITPYDDMLLTFGGVIDEPEGAKPYMRTDLVSLYFTESWNSPMELPAGSYYSWYLSMMWKENLTGDERQDKYGHPDGDEGWFFPGELYETKVMEYFDVTPEYLRSELLIYDTELKGYYLPMGGGIGERPEIVLRDADEDGDTVRLHLSLLSAGISAMEQKMILTVKKTPGGFRYESWLPE